MMDLNFRRSHNWLRSDTLVPPAGNKRSHNSLLLILLLNVLLLVAASAFGADVTVNLIDAQNNQRINNTQITAYRIAADGSRDWYSRQTTDENGQATFALQDIENGINYQLRSKAFNGFKSYSDLLSNQAVFDFMVGKVRVTLKNGSVEGLPTMPNTEVSVKFLKDDGKWGWYGSATSDETGLLKLDLPQINNGQVYRLGAKSTLNQSNKYSDPLTGEGDFDFVVGNKPLTVNLKDAATQSPLGAQRVTVYWLDENDKRKWHSRAETDSNGVVIFDLEELGSGTRYVLRTEVYNDFKVYTGPITVPGTVDLSVGRTRVAVLNGNEATNPPLVEHKVKIYKVLDDGKNEYFASAYTDQQGMLRIDLPGVDNGQPYKLAADSPVSGQTKYSEVHTRSGDHQFVVGNKPLIVTLVDGVSQAPISLQRIDVYQLDAAGKKDWYARAETDESGKVSFDLAGLGSGTAYMLRTKVFNNTTTFTKPIASAGDFTFKVGTTMVDVVNGTVNPAQPLADHKVYFYELLSDGETSYFGSIYSDTNGFIRVDLPDLNNGKSYLVKSKSPTDGRTYYQAQVSVEGVTELVVGSTPLTVTLQDAISGQTLADKKISVHEILANGDKDWFTSKTTDAQGVALFDLPGLGGDRQFRLSVRGFDDYKTYADVSAPGPFAFNVGSVAVNLKNGSVAGSPVLANHRLSISRFNGEKFKGFGSATSDANGVVRLDLPEVDQGVIYRFHSPSPVNESSKYSEAITQSGTMDFVVGNPAVQVTLSNILSGELYPGEKVTAYRIDEAGDFQWYGRIVTDESGVASFDLNGIDQGESYVFKANKFESGGSYSQILSTSGNFDFGIGAVPVTLVDKDTEQIKTGVKVKAYRIVDGQLKWAKSGYTDSTGKVIFDLQGLGEGERFAFKASNPFGESKHYYGPIIWGIGALTFYIKQGEYGELDMTAPEVTIVTPEADIANAAGFTVTGIATDNQSVGHVEVTVTDPVAGSNTVVASYDENSLQWQANILGEWVSSGQTATVTATAYDLALNTNSTSRSFVITEDVTPPAIAITSHQNLDPVNVTGFTVLGTVEDDIGVASITATVTDPVLGQTIINQPLNISSLSGQWAFPVTNGQVSTDSQVTISLLATDVNGRTTEATLLLTSLQISTNPVQLVQRITFGLTPELLARVKRGDDILAEQLNPDAIDDTVFEAAMAAMPVVDRESLKNYLTTYMTGSKKQLREVMAWFWENHFNTNINTHGFAQWELRENNLFRQHALGNFRDLLQSSAKSPAMIRYLNNAQNVAGRANENYAREVMELHTMGVDGGYTSGDIEELSRIFTGWHETDGVFTFNDELHDNGDKVFLGQTVLGNGVGEGEQVLDILSTHSSTASFICSKLVTLFVSDQPVSSLQGQCAAEFLATGGDISAVLRVIFGSEQFAAPEHYRSKVKTPLEFMISTARGFNATVTPSRFNNELRDMGMRLFEYPAPTGFSEVSADWLNSNAVLQRMRLVNQAALHDSDALDIDFRQLMLSQGYSSAEAIVSYLFELAVSSDFTDLEYQIALAILNDQSVFDINENDADDKLRRLLGTVLSFPGFQYQ